MNDEIKKLETQLLQKIQEAQLASNISSPQELYTIGATINTILTFLTAPQAKTESDYYNVVLKAKQDGESMASAEAIGKASSEYYIYRALKLLCERGHESFIHTKKLMDALNNEAKRL